MAASATVLTNVLIVAITATVAVGAARACVPTVRVTAAIVHRHTTVGRGAGTTAAPVAVTATATAGIATAAATGR